MPTRLAFTLKHWCAWQSASISGPGWPGGEILPNHQGSADVSFLPMMQRRRLSPLARAACAVAWNCRQAESEMPSIFYSAHGESSYFFEMLEEMTAGEPVSPSRFSLAVHNAIVGQFSLYSENVLPYVALAGGSEGLFAGFIEAAGMLLQAPNVMLVCYDQPLPEVYRPYLSTAEQTWALAMVLAKPDQAGGKLHLLREPSTASDVASLNQETDLLHSMVNDQRNGSCQLKNTLWRWQLGQDT